MEPTIVVIGVILAGAICWYLVARMFRRPKPVPARSVFNSNETFRLMQTPTTSRRARATSPAQTTGVYDASDDDGVEIDIDINTSARSGDQKSLDWPGGRKDYDHDRANTSRGSDSDSDGSGDSDD